MIRRESDRGMDFLDWLLAILRFVLWLLAVAIWIATIIPAIILDVATYGPRLAAYYAIQLPLYNMLKAQRAVMVMTGYLYPMQDEIDIGLVQLGTGSQKLFKEMLSAMDNIFGIGDAGASTSETEPVPDKSTLVSRRRTLMIMPSSFIILGFTLKPLWSSVIVLPALTSLALYRICWKRRTSR